MTVFDLEEKPGIWLDMEGGGRIQVRAVSQDDMKAIRKLSTKKMAEITRIDGVLGRVEWEEVDEDMQNALFWDKCIIGWENFVDKKGGKPIPCTMENKRLLINKSQKLLKLVTEALKSLSDDENERAQAAEKN